jgi:hypothetical protein
MLRLWHGAKLKSTARSLSVDVALYVLLGVLCVLIGSNVYRMPDYAKGVEIWSMAAVLSVGCGVVVSFMTISPAYRTLPIAIPMIAMFFRTGIYMGAVLYAGATKWSHQNYYTNCLLGCFFPFLVLESVLSIRRSSHS